MLEVVLSSFPFLSWYECSSIIKEKNKVEGVEKFVVVTASPQKLLLGVGAPNLIQY
jgi:hypothetical protein